MSTPKTYDQCLDLCEEKYPPLREGYGENSEFGAYLRCLDGCDERFAAGKEPAAPADFGMTPAEGAESEAE